MTTFAPDTASPALRALMRAGEGWQPVADGRAYIVNAAGERRLAHRHFCLVCSDVVGWSDDCESDGDHDYELCPAHVDSDV